MNVVRRTLLSFLGSVGLMVAVPASAQSIASLPPDRLVEVLSADLLKKIKEDKAIQAGDMAKLSALVDSTVMPYVNFDRLTMFAVGKGWRQASPEQKNLLKQEFRTLLLYTYAGAMAAIKDQSIKVKPLRGNPDVATEMIVRSEVVSPGKEPIALDYRMEKSPEGWRVYDMSVLSVWLGEAHRSQFSQELSKSGVDGLIKSLIQKNKELAAGKK